MPARANVINLNQGESKVSGSIVALNGLSIPSQYNVRRWGQPLVSGSIVASYDLGIPTGRLLTHTRFDTRKSYRAAKQ